MEEYYSFVKKLADAFDNAKLNYAFTGTLAVSFYGVPRTTTDIDVMVVFSAENDFSERTASALGQAGVVVDQRKLEAALTSGYSIATFRTKTAPYTVNVILTNGELARKQGKIDGLSTFFQSPEGLIAAKLRMIKATLPPELSAKDREDVKAILKFTQVNVEAVKKQARADCTLEIFKALT